MDMDAITRLKMLSSQMHLEPAEETHCPQLSDRKRDAIVVSDAALPNGKRITLLKTLLTSVCERDCYYCAFRAGRDFLRATFKPEEFARVFLAINKANIAEGLFLSSGVISGGMHTQDLLLSTAEVLRLKLGFRGYIHLKIMPGAERAQVERAMQLADRISVNLEAPNTERLEKLAPRKQFIEELLQPLRWIEEIRHEQPAYRGWNGHWPSSVTQFVVGAAGESDLELITTSDYLYNQLHLKRIYFSTFNPIKDTPLENHPPASPIREHRLYQSSFLIRDYGFSMEELPFTASGNLPLDIDPKLAWATEHLAEQPVDLNRADHHELLRVPGIGPQGVKAILATRQHHPIRCVEDLRRIGINPTRASPFILLDGRRPTHQLTFW